MQNCFAHQENQTAIISATLITQHLSDRFFSRIQIKGLVSYFRIQHLHN